MPSSNRFPDNAFDGSEPTNPADSFEPIDHFQLAEHLKVDQYDEFILTDAVRPAMDLKVRPIQGYRHDTYVDQESGAKVPVVMAAATRHTLFPLFMDLIQRLGPVVDVVLESSHDSDNAGHVDHYREHIDMPVLTSVLWEYENLLTHDGCTGIAVLNPNTPQEVQFDEHKLLIVYGSPLEPFEFLMERHGVSNRNNMRFITEAEHIHSSSSQFRREFERLRTDLGLDGCSSIQPPDQLGEV